MYNIKSLRLAFLVGILLSFPLATAAQSDKGKTMSEEHRSKVASVVSDLTQLAGKDKNIGEEVRQVAQDQGDSEERITASMEKVEKRGKFRTFFFGTDYKSIGALRSELVTTDNHITRLTQAKNRTDDVQVKAELQTQITALEEAKSSVELFIKENESKFSLLGWLVRF